MTPSLEQLAQADLQAADPEAERLAMLAEFEADIGVEVEDKREFHELLRDLITPFTNEEFAAAKEPNPHVFREHHTGIFPVGEVTIIAGAGREGKTTAEVGIAAALAMNRSLGGLWPLEHRMVVIYSAEDDRSQYARKVAAQHSLMRGEPANLIQQRLRVPNLDHSDFRGIRSLVMVLQGQPVPTGTIEIIINALRPMMEGPNPPGLLIFETASTLSDAEETNPGFRVLILALRRIARELGVAVLLSHHVSQASLANLPTLDVSTTDIRGGTALVNNARQCGLLVNLGSEEDPFPDADARTVLRQMAAGDVQERVTVLITLDSSKGVNPPPVFFKWINTEYGPAAVEHEPPGHLRGKPWRKVHSMIKAERAGMRAEAKQEAKEAQQHESMRCVLDIVKKLHQSGRQATARAVSIEAGKSFTWATPHLLACVAAELLIGEMEKVPRCKEPVMVYRPIHSTAHSTGGV